MTGQPRPRQADRSIASTIDVRVRRQPPPCRPRWADPVRPRRGPRATKLRLDEVPVPADVAGAVDEGVSSPSSSAAGIRRSPRSCTPVRNCRPSVDSSRFGEAAGTVPFPSIGLDPSASSRTENPHELACKRNSAWRQGHGAIQAFLRGRSGLEGRERLQDSVFFVPHGGSLVGFYGREGLADMVGASPDGSGFSGVVFNYVVRSEARVDEVLDGGQEGRRDRSSSPRRSCSGAGTADPSQTLTATSGISATARWERISPTPSRGGFAAPA